MSKPVILGSQHRLVVGDKIDKRWHEFLRLLTECVATSEQVTAIATALGSPDGTIENIPAPSGSSGTTVRSTDQILVTGSPASGYFVDLQRLLDSGAGALLGITRDRYGRISGTTDATITGTAGEIDVADGDAVAGPPTLSLADVADSGTGTLQKTAFDTKGRKTGTAAATTDDLDEGAANLYYTDARADARVAAGIATHEAAADPHPDYVRKSTLASLTDAADDAAAATAGVAVGAMYRTGSTLKVRIS